MTTVDIFGKTIHDFGSVSDEGLSFSDANNLFLQKEGYTVSNAVNNPLTSTSCFELTKWFVSLMHIWTGVRTVRRRTSCRETTRRQPRQNKSLFTS